MLISKKNYQVPSKNNIFGVMVTYHPDSDLRKRVEQIRKQINTLLIVDNNSSSDSLSMIREVCFELNVVLIENKKNLGIATALNQGFEFAKSFGKKFLWILTLDQDSYCFSNFVDHLRQTYVNCPYKKEVAVIGTNYKEKISGRLLHESSINNIKWEQVKNLPTSGSITSLDAYLKNGRFRDDFFIDYVDTEYCMRLRRKGYKILISTNVGMIHSLGTYRKSKFYQFLFKKDLVTNYNPLRHYYWTRNGTILICKNFFIDFFWAINEIYYIFFRRVITVILFEDNKLIKLFNIALGFLHGIFLKTGSKK